MELADWIELQTQIDRCSHIKRGKQPTNSSVVQENYQAGSQTQSQIETLADAICRELDWQARQMELKAQRKVDAMQRRYRNKVLVNQGDV